ncbi:hypothetical protein I4U23_029917 [Adineta vaga]|nr:hypothetical protein I4U23_029917 [Adineta vaga]
MSNPSRQQRRFPSRTPVRISRNYPKLPPIPQTAHSIDPDNDSDKHISIIHPAEHTLPSTKLVPITPVLSNEDLSTKPVLDGTDIESNRDLSTSIDVSEFWAKLRRHIANESLSNPDDHGCQQTPNKVVRIFVSSTFTDFFNEREILIKKVFPELRDELEPVGLQIIDCDLRWGVPKDSTTEQTILTCLEELDRCFEDNGQPFFIGLISDKYGWVPKLHELPDNIKERYRWIDGASITLMEFIHGAFRTHNPNAFFLIRKSENILKNLPEKYTDKFRDKDEISQKQVLELKHQLSQIVPPEHIFQYDCFYNGLDSTTGRERVRVDGLEEFGMKAKEFLSEAIKNWYSENFDNATSIDAEQKQMNTFLLNKTQFFVDRSEEFSMLLKYISDDPIDGKKPHKISADPVDHQPIMSIVSPAGDGKTMLLGKFVLHIEETMKDKFFLFYHFLDGAFHPTGSSFMHANLTQKLNKYLDEHQLISPNTGERPNVTDENFIREAIALLPVPFVIIIDGLDKGDIHHQRKYHEEFLFANYKDLASNHTYMLISSEPNSPLYHEIRRYDYYELYLKPLTIEQRSTYVENFFQRFNKVR